ncbi:MAG TPA: acyl-CoA carboxylase subunit beta [Polyangiales bacterium]|jgi:acetyl-CoA carboxylase carboxyltransferase component
MSADQKLLSTRDQIQQGGGEKYQRKNSEEGKLFVRERIRRLIDPGSFVEDALFANQQAEDLPADGVIIGTALVDGRPIAIMANDSTVKAGSWGKRTVEKILRIQELAQRLACPLLYLVDSAGARITDQIEMFPGRRGAGRIFYNQTQMSGQIPQLCLLFGPSAAGGAYIPAFCDLVIMVDKNASMYLGSPRMAEMVIGEKVSLEEMGGATMHTSVSGCGDLLAKSEDEAIALARRYLSFMPSNAQSLPPSAATVAPAASGKTLEQIIPPDEQKSFDMLAVLRELVDADSFFEVKPKFARELVTGFARIDGKVVGVVANQPKWLGGVLFVDSADKAARFIQVCDSFNVPLLFLADVPGFMIGTKVERQGIIRAGAKMIAAVSQASVPKLSVIVRKAYGAGLYAMCGPAFEPDACIALPQASIAVMGPDAAVNAVFYNKIQACPEGEERRAYVETLRAEYRASIDLYKLASDLVIDAIVPSSELRSEIVGRLLRRPAEPSARGEKKHPVWPM